MLLILDLLRADGVAPKRVASTHGGEYAGACPVCGGRDRFRVWPEEGQQGKWWCRGCNKGGDLVQYLRDIRNMSYKEACDFLGQKPRLISRSLWSSPDQPKWTPRETTPPHHKWIARCGSFVDWAQEQLLWSDKYKDRLDWLKSERGLSEDTIKAYRLGWNPQTYWRDRSAWGLPEECKKNGKPKKVWLPEGLVIPYYAQNNSLLRTRIRLFQGITTYCLVSGSSTRPMILGDNRKIFVVVESELDAILLHQEIEDMAGVIALGNAQSRPDKLTTELLRKAELILIALDGDDPGAKEAWGWWPDHFDQAKRWPPIEGKDPGEMLSVGIDLRKWVEVGIEECLPQPIDQGHQPEAVADPGDQVEPVTGEMRRPEQLNTDTLGHRLESLYKNKLEPASTDLHQKAEAIQKQRALIIKVSGLEKRIIDALQGRPLPIKITPCEQITDVAGYAEAEARNAYHQSRHVRESARARLMLLEIDIEER